MMVPFYEHRTVLLQSRREDECFSFPMHIHDRVEFIFVHSGALSLNMIGKSLSVGEGELAVIFPYIAHGYDCGGKAVDYSIVIARSEDTGDFSGILSSCYPESPVIPAKLLHRDVPDIISQLVAMDSQKYGEADFTSTCLLKALLQLLLARTAKQLSLEANTGEAQTNLVVRALSYVSEHYREQITLESVAESLMTSRFAVSRLFSERIHTGFLKYVNHLRVEYAKNLLSSTGMNVLDIALESGYENLRTFNRVFKNACGQSPLSYRKKVFINSRINTEG